MIKLQLLLMIQKGNSSYRQLLSKRNYGKNDDLLLKASWINEGSCRSWKTRKVICCDFRRHGKWWNLKCGSWKVTKMVWVVQNKLGRLFFVLERIKKVPEMKRIFENFEEKWCIWQSWEKISRPWHTWKSLKSDVKSNGKSWNSRG